MPSRESRSLSNSDRHSMASNEGTERREIQISIDKSSAKFRPKRHKRKGGGDHRRGEEQSAPYLAWQGAGAGGRGAELTKRRERGSATTPRRNICVCKGFDSTDILWHFWRREPCAVDPFLAESGGGGNCQQAARCLLPYSVLSRESRKEGGRGGRKEEAQV